MCVFSWKIRVLYALCALPLHWVQRAKMLLENDFFWSLSVWNKVSAKTNESLRKVLIVWWEGCDRIQLLFICLSINMRFATIILSMPTVWRAPFCLFFILLWPGFMSSWWRESHHCLYFFIHKLENYLNKMALAGHS